jgi:hypothetical protein
MKPGEMPPMKEFVSSAVIKHTRTIKAVGGGSVPDYMRLPIDQYAIYDARLMRRIPKTEDGEDDLFEFRLPTLRPPEGQFAPQPKVCMRVRPTDDSISIESISASLFGDMDGLPPNTTADELEAATQQMKQMFNFAFNTTLAWKPSKKLFGKAAEGDTDLAATTKVCLTISLPFTRVPRPLVQSAIGIIMRFVGKAILPRFAQLLEADYQRWCNGTRGELSAGFGQFPIDDDGFMLVDQKKLDNITREMIVQGRMKALEARGNVTTGNWEPQVGELSKAKKMEAAEIFAELSDEDISRLADEAAEIFGRADPGGSDESAGDEIGGERIN